MDLSRLSRNSLFVLDAASTHNIQFDDPELVARAVELVVDAAANRLTLSRLLLK